MRARLIGVLAVGLPPWYRPTPRGSLRLPATDGDDHRSPCRELGTVCIYEASDEDAVRRHADMVGMPADEVLPVADTVIVRPDPQPAAAG